METLTLMPNQCNIFRNPMPDYYSIALEISRDRATRAEEFVCDSTDPHRQKCPPEYRDGDKYVLRSRDTPCVKMVSPNICI